MGKKAGVIMTAALLALWSGSVRADSLEVLGASSRGTAMGGAMISIAEGWEAAYYNSSALALSRDSSSFQVSVISGELIQNDDNILGGGPAFKYGINRRFLRDRIGLGLLIGTSALASGGGLDVGSIVSMISGGGGGGWQRYSDSLPLLLSVGVGFRITNWLSVGITAYEKPGLISTSYWQLPVVDEVLFGQILGLRTGIYMPNVNELQFSTGSEPGEDFVTGFNVTFRPIKYLSFGYMYKPETWTRVRLRLDVMGAYGSILTQSWLFAWDMKFPGQVETTVLGAAAHIPIPWNDGTLTLSYAQETQNWDGHYPVSKSYDYDALDQFYPEYFQDRIPPDPGLKDVTFPRYGIEYVGDATPLLFWKLKDLKNARFAVRGGYYHWETPQPDVNYSWQMVMIDSDADVYSFGLGFGYDRKKKSRAEGLPPPRVEFDFHFQQTKLDDRVYRDRGSEWGGISLTNYITRTEGEITNYGFQVTWLR